MIFWSVWKVLLVKWVGVGPTLYLVYPNYRWSLVRLGLWLACDNYWLRYFPISAAGYATKVQQAMLQVHQAMHQVQQAILKVQQAMLQVQQAILKVQQAMLRETKNKADPSRAEVELELSLAKIPLRVTTQALHLDQKIRKPI